MPNENIVLKLHDYLVGECKFKGCSKNKLGLCTSNDIDHMNYIAKIIKHSLNTNTGVLTNQNIICNEFDVREGYCEWCNEKMIEHTDYRPYGNIQIPYKFYECPKC